MKKWKSILLAVLAVGSLASCDSGEPITRQVAMAKVSSASETMTQADGYSLEADSRATFSLSLKDAEKNEAMKMKMTATADAEAAILFQEGKLSSGKLTGSAGLNLTMTAGGETQKEKMSAAAELYYKEATVYAKAGVKANDADEQTAYYVSTIDELLAIIQGTDGDSSSEADIDLSTILAMIESLKTEFAPYMDYLPDPTIKTSGNKETITWSMNDKDLNKLLNDVMTAEIMSSEFPEGTTLESLPKEIADVLSATVKEAVSVYDKLIDLNTIKLTVTISDQSWISGLSFALDLDINDLPLGEDGTNTNYLSLGIDTKTSLSLSKIDSAYAIDYPSDLDTWASKMAA